MIPDRLTGRFVVDAETACWNWQGGTSMGYGVLTVRSVSPQPMRTHRYSWVLWRGPIPKGLHVLHRCDNKLCVNPQHLYVGTNQDNRDDTNGKHKAYNDNGRFDTSDIDNIRARIAAKESDASIARVYGCSYQAIGAIRTGKNWGWYA